MRILYSCTWNGCPRLLHVLPLYASNGRGCHNLETIEIVCCGELREIFPSDLEVQQQEPREFPRLKGIHLYELPMLQHIYGHHMLAPNLETVKIRGCWNLKRMPAVRRPTRRRHRRGTPADEAELLDSAGSSDNSESDEEEAQTLPTVDCEKDWWDSFEWERERVRPPPFPLQAVPLRVPQEEPAESVRTQVNHEVASLLPSVFSLIVICSFELLHAALTRPLL